jgi:hypothetical protein
MGHYDDCMDADDFERSVAERKHLVKYLRRQIKEMTLEELLLVEEIIDNMSEYRTFFYVLNKGRP